jgi:hypothetical protein
MQSAGDDREISRLKEKETSLRYERDKLREEREELNRIIRESEREFQQLQAENQALVDRLHGFENSRDISLQKEDARVTERLADLERQKDEMVHQCKLIGQENKRLQDQTATFRAMIIKKGGESDQVDDATISRAFINLRTRIQKIVHKHYQADPQKQPTTRRTTPDPYELLAYWDQGLSSSQIQNRLRATLFSIIHERFLSIPIFGLEDSGSTGEIERGLIRFELALEEATAGRESHNSTDCLFLILCRPKY